MIRYPCAACERELEVDDALAGNRARCPHCSNIEVVPTLPRQSGKPQRKPAALAVRPEDDDRAAALGLPSASGPEQVARKVHPVVFRARPVLSSLVVLAIAAGITFAAAVHISAVGTFLHTNRWLAFIGWGIVAAGLLVFGWWKIESWGASLTITNKRTTLRTGLLHRHTREILHGQINDLIISQTFAQRLLNVGSIGIDGAGTDHIEITLDGVPDPVGVRRVIDTYRPIA